MNVKKTLAASTAALVLIGSALPASAAGIDASYVKALKENGTADLILNVDAYRAAYPYLDAAFGDDTNAYIMHYLTAGMYEGRTMGVLFNPLAYAEAYSDIKEAFGDDISAVVNHYVTFGIAENRTAGTAGAYTDLAEAQLSMSVTPQENTSLAFITMAFWFGESFMTQTTACSNIQKLQTVTALPTLTRNQSIPLTMF